MSPREAAKPAAQNTMLMPVAEARVLEPYLIAKRGDLAALLEGSKVTPDRFIKTVLHSIAKQPDILGCTRESVLLACLEAAELGLEPTGKTGGAHLVKFKNTKTGKDEATLIVGYEGMVMGGLRSGQVGKVEADVVYEGDKFYYQRGTDPRIDHVPTLDDTERGNISHAYAVVFDRQHRVLDFAVMTRAEIEVIRKRARSGDKGPWVSDWPEMAKKTCVRRVFKLVPQALTPQLAAALEREDDFERELSTAPTTLEFSDRRGRVLARLTGTPQTASDAQNEGSGPAATAGAPAPAVAVVDGQPADSEEGLPD